MINRISFETYMIQLLILYKVIIRKESNVEREGMLNINEQKYYTFNYNDSNLKS